MLSKQFIVFQFVIILETTNAIMIKMNRGSSCRHHIQNERDDAINKYNNLDKLKEFVTLNSCPVSNEFNYENKHFNGMMAISLYFLIILTTSFKAFYKKEL